MRCEAVHPEIRTRCTKGGRHPGEHVDEGLREWRGPVVKNGAASTGGNDLIGGLPLPVWIVLIGS